MQHKLKGKDLAALLALYNREVDTLRAQLLNGESWEALKQQRKNVTELAIALHKYHNYVVPAHPAQLPQLEASSQKPAK
jgi:hypothetical protein